MSSPTATALRRDRYMRERSEQAARRQDPEYMARQSLCATGDVRFTTMNPAQVELLDYVFTTLTEQGWKRPRWLQALHDQVLAAPANVSQG
jgi:hypothetical protein